jgi:uncharacterized protein (TIGR02246 family)
VEASLEERLRHLEDLDEIRRLIIDYAAALDARDLASYAELFARDGEWSGRTGHARTPEGIRRLMEERLHPNPPAPGPTHRHVVTNVVAEIDGDRASAQTSWTLFARSEGDEPEITMQGTYRDTLVREDGRWRFASRKTDIDIPRAFQHSEDGKGRA